MGTAILRSHDCLQGRLRHDALSLTATRTNPNPNPNHARRRKRSPVAVNSNSQDRSRFGRDGSAVVVKGPGANLVMGQVKILKRGEKLSPENPNPKPKTKTKKKSEERFDLALGSTDRLGPDPETMQKQIRVPDLKDAMYAGSAFVTSPPPSSVPVPGFIGKSNGAATTDLRRLLRLDLV